MKPAVQASPSHDNLPLIDVLRGLAAFWVVLFHVRVDLWVGLRDIQSGAVAANAFEKAIAWLSAPMMFGGSGVMLFFVLSGFCVHLPLAGGKRFDWKPYAARRFFRIFPPYLVAIALTLACEHLSRALGTAGRVSDWDTVLRSVFMVQNYGANAGQMAGNPSLWSLPVEMELYLVYPLFLGLLRVAGAAKTFAVVAAVSVIPAVFGHQVPVLDGSFLPYWLIWCAGAWLAEAWKTGALSRPGAVHAIVMLFGFAAAAAMHLAEPMLLRNHGIPLERSHWLTCHLWAVGYGILLWFVLMNPGLPSRIPAKLLSLLVWVGALSYSLYLVHFPLFRLAGDLWQKQAGSKPVNFLIPLVAAVLVVPLAALFYKLVEAPSHRLARDIGQRLKRVPNR